MTQATWYNAERVRQPGSVVLARWMAAGGARRGDTPRAENGTMSMQEFSDWVLGNSDVAAGVVSERSVLSISAAYACVSLIGGAIASLPLKFYRRQSDGEREEYKPDFWWLFNEQAMPCWSAATAWEYAAASLLLQGDSFWRIHRVAARSAAIAAVEPLHPATVTVRRSGDRLKYTVTAQPSQETSPGQVVLDQDDVLHVAGPGFNGLRGLSQIASALSTPGSISLQADRWAQSFFTNSARPDFALVAPGKLDQEQIDQLRSSWIARYGGASRSHLPAVLAGGLDVKPLTMLAKDAEVLETRRFQVEDIARIFGVPPFMIGHTDKTTSWGSGVEAMAIGFVKFTLQRHLVKFEQEINRKVFRTDRNFCEFDTAGLERGDIKTRNESYRFALGRAGEPGWMTVNEVRRRENLPPIDGGDELSGMADAADPAADPSTDPGTDPATDPTGPAPAEGLAS